LLREKLNELSPVLQLGILTSRWEGFRKSFLVKHKEKQKEKRARQV
jgi:hypothetical protein